MYGNSIPAGTAGGDLFEYINFQQRYDLDGGSGEHPGSRPSICGLTRVACRVILPSMNKWNG